MRYEVKLRTKTITCSVGFAGMVVGGVVAAYGLLVPYATTMFAELAILDSSGVIIGFEEAMVSPSTFAGIAGLIAVTSIASCMLLIYMHNQMLSSQDNSEENMKAKKRCDWLMPITCILPAFVGGMALGCVCFGLTFEQIALDKIDQLSEPLRISGGIILTIGFVLFSANLYWQADLSPIAPNDVKITS